MANHSLAALDYAILVGSMLMSAAIGFYFTNKNKSMDAYMLGDRKMSVIPVAISLMSSSLSGLSLLGSSSEVYYQGPTYAFVALALLLCGPVIAHSILPVFYHMNELSLYQYLYHRFGAEVKYIVTVIYMLQMIFFNSVVLYVPSMALQSLLGIEKFYSILLIGILCVVYSGIGGIKAVIWTDLFQALLMYTAIIVVGVVGTIEGGGLVQIFHEANKGGRLNLDGFFSMDPTQRHTLIGVVLGLTIKQTYLVGVNQVQMQRAVSLPSLKQSQYSIIFCSIFGAFMSILASFMGIVLYSAYRSCDPFLADEIPRRDAIIVHYVANRLYTIPGLRGVFIAGVFSATLSTLSSFANSMSALAIEDFIKPVRTKLKILPMDNKIETWLAKFLAFSFGLICVLMAYLVDKANSRLLQATTTMFGAIGVPFLASFMLGIYTRYINKWGILAALLVTLPFGAYMTVYQTFFTPALVPTMPIYYDERCARVFNMTMNPQDLPSIIEQFGVDVLLPQARRPFSLNQISYIMMPVIQSALTFVIASIVSILTGGWNQQMDDRYLAELIHSPSSLSGVLETEAKSEKRSYDVSKTTSKAICEFKSKNIEAVIDEQSHVSERKRKLGVINNNLGDIVPPTNF